MSRRRGIGFAVFCLIGGSQWLADTALPSVLPLFERESLHYLLVGIVATSMLIVRRRSLRPLQVQWLRLAMASLMLLGIPELLGEAAHRVSAATRVGLFALVPLLVVVGASSFREELTQGRVLMMPALAGFSGMLLLVPFQLPSGTATSLSFVLDFAAVLLTAIGSLWMYGLLRQCGVTSALVILCGANAFLMGLAADLTHQFIVPLTSVLLVELLRCAIFDLPLLLLLVWVLRELFPPKLAVRFLLIPLLSAFEGAILLHTGISLRMACGIILIVIGSGALLFWRATDDLESGPLLGLQ